MYKTGETIGQGTYVCRNCGQNLQMDENQTLPPCPRCTNTTFSKK
ncbi:MAG: hypothetical protein IJF72_04075 [Clostridia bacterium]|nr:hypothetical protein [Clostridia bacterium]